jgi:hypothetical protein
MPRIRRGNYVFVSWKGDHSPRHVHVYRDRKLVVKWDLESERSMKGRPTAWVLVLIRRLVQEGLL